jgi:hypothetical protein
MIAPLQTKEESKRLDTLHRLDILDSLPEKYFDVITKIAAEICQTPISLINLLDDDRRWFKSKRGLDISETHRDLSF